MRGPATIARQMRTAKPIDLHRPIAMSDGLQIYTVNRMFVKFAQKGRLILEIGKCRLSTRAEALHRAIRRYIFPKRRY